MEPIITSALISAGASLAGGAGSTIAGGKMNRRASREAARTRDWQTSEREASQLAQDEQIRKNLGYSFDYEKAMKAYDFSNYSSPAARMEALRKAGLNPDMVYGSGIGSGTPASVSVPSLNSSAVTAPSGPVADVDAGAGLVGQGIQSVTDAPRRVADLNLIDSQVQKNKSDSRKSDSEVLLNGSRIELTDAQADWTKEDKQRILTDIRNMDIEANKLNAEIDKLRADVKFVKASTAEKRELVKELQATLSDRIKRYAFQNRKALAEAGLTERHLEYYENGISSMLLSLASDANLKMNEAARSNELRRLDQKQYSFGGHDATALEILQDITFSVLSNNSALLEKQLDLLKDYGDAKEYFGIVSTVIGSLGSVLRSATVAR